MISAKYLTLLLMIILFPGMFVLISTREPARGQAARTDSLVNVYKSWSDKGPVIDKRRATIFCAANTIHVKDTLVVYHVFEEMKNGRFYSIADEKAVCSEYVNGQLMVCPGDSSYTSFWFCDCGQDSTRVTDQPETAGPGIITNFKNPKYTFESPGIYTIQWRPGKQVSNTLTIRVE